MGRTRAGPDPAPSWSQRPDPRSSTSSSCTCAGTAVSSSRPSATDHSSWSPGTTTCPSSRPCSSGTAQAGASSRARWDGLARALSEADQAAARTAQAPFATFDEIASEGIAAAIDPSDAARIARHRLAPLLDDARTLDELRTWLTHHGAWDPAARELGLHRHTLRAHVETAFTAIGLDPDRFEDRAELWLALNAVGRQGD